MCTFLLLDGLFHLARMVLLLKMHPLLLLQTILYNTHLDIPPSPAMGRVFNMTSNIWPKRQLPTSIAHPVPESTNRYSILTVYDANNDPTDTSPKQGITAGPYMNEDLESDGALLTNNKHAEVGSNPATRPAKRPASSSLRVKVSNEKATTILPVTLMTETMSRQPFGCAPLMTHDRSGDTKPHARALQSSVAEGCADFEKGGPQARSVTPPRSHLRRTAETAPTESPNASKDKARDSERVTMRTTPVSTGNNTTDADPHAASAPSTSDPGGDQHATGNAVAQPASTQPMPIQPGGAMIPPGSQDRRTARCATADAAPSNNGVLKETKN